MKNLESLDFFGTHRPLAYRMNKRLWPPGTIFSGRRGEFNDDHTQNAFNGLLMAKSVTKGGKTKEIVGKTPKDSDVMQLTVLSDTDAVRVELFMQGLGFHPD